MNRPSILFCLAGGVLVAALAFGGPARRGCGPAPTGSGPGCCEAAPVAGAGPAEEGALPDATRANPAVAASSQPERASARQPLAELADPDRVGECPPWNGQPASSPTIRRGIDGDGFPTWWHADGSLTKRVIQTGKDASGNPFRLPATLRLARPGVRGDAIPDAAAALQK